MKKRQGMAHFLKKYWQKNNIKYKIAQFYVGFSPQRIII